MENKYQHLTPADVEHFLTHGYVVIREAFSRDAAQDWTRDVWARLGMDPEDKTTWAGKERIHMPSTNRVRVSEFAPRAWGAICDLLGGEECIAETGKYWSDGFIVNLGTDELEGAKPMEPRELDNWHVDGDFFIHFLDSPEQALLVIPVFSDIKPTGGATYIAPDGIPLIANYLHAHPEGVLPVDRQFLASTGMNQPLDYDPAYSPADPTQPGYWSHVTEVRKHCNDFVEMTGAVGDVVLLHPLMMHSASKNHLRVPRIITNPPVALRKPFVFDREDARDYSLVERKTLAALGVERLEGWKAIGERREVVPKRVYVQQKMREDEERRMSALRAAEGTRAH